MPTIEGDRRRHPRILINRPCKVYDPHTRKYMAGNAVDMSDGGLLIELPRLIELKPGDRLHVGVAFKRREALLHRNEMVNAEVMRIIQTVDDRTLLGLRVDQAQDHVATLNQSPLRIAA